MSNEKQILYTESVITKFNHNGPNPCHLITEIPVPILKLFNGIFKVNPYVLFENKKYEYYDSYYGNFITIDEYHNNQASTAPPLDESLIFEIKDCTTFKLYYFKALGRIAGYNFKNLALPHDLSKEFNLILEWFI